MAARYLGKIKSFNVQKGWGFIECEETFEIYGKDIFIMKRVLPNGVANKGDLVTFDVQQGAGGPEATTVDLEPGDSGPTDLDHLLTGNSNAAGAWSVPQRAPAMPVAAAVGACGTAGLAARSSGFLGFVKSYNPTKGWGFVTSDVLLQLYGKDVFFLKNSLLSPNVSPGDPVRFSISQGSKGPEAVDVTLDTFAAMGAGNVGGGAAATYGAVGGFAGRRAGPVGGAPPRLAGGCGGFWSMPGAAVPALPAAPVVPQQVRAMASQVLFGTVKSYHPEKGWGHIDCGPASAFYGKDVFLMRSALEDQVVQPGSLVSFRVVMAPKGPHASDVKVLPEGSFSTAGGGGGGQQQASPFEGVVKSYNVEKGWGFVTSAEIQQVFGKDIFIHKQELGGIVPEPGDLVHFTVEPGRTGQLEAKRVVVAGQPGFPAYKMEPRSSSAEGARSAPY